MMRGGTLFSGIGAPEMAAPEIDWRWAAEIDSFASAVHAARLPGVTNLGDVTEISPDAIEPVDVIVFGSPCQSFSVAGKRLGLDDARGNLALVALRLIGRIRPLWVVFENVPGFLSSDEGRDFGAFLGLLGECGYGFAYRILDAQHAGVPQRRRRVFVVGYLGDWRPAAAVLFEPESLRGDTAPRRETWQGIAASLTHGVDSGGKGGYAGRRREDDISLIALRGHSDYGEGLPSLRADGGDCAGGSEALIAHTLRADGFDASEDGTGRGTPLIAQAVTADYRHVRPEKDRGTVVKSGMSVRRLTPTECEKLQGFPPGWTAITYRGKPAADGPRYRALGNSMAVPVVRWILHRIVLFHESAERLVA